MPFGKDTLVIPSNIVLDRGPSPPLEGEIWGSKPQFVVMSPVAKLLGPCLCYINQAISCCLGVMICVNRLCSMTTEFRGCSSRLKMLNSQLVDLHHKVSVCFCLCIL